MRTKDSGAVRQWRWLVWLVAGCLVVLIGALLPRQKEHQAGPIPESAGTGDRAISERVRTRSSGLAGPRNAVQRLSAEEIVAGKVTQFARDREAVLGAMAKHFKVPVRPEVERFFEAAKAGEWNEVKARFDALNERRRTEDHADDLAALWPVILETYGVAEAAHDWPAQKLLDYGQAVLGSLRPDMVYVGGTDPGRFIPTLLNETTEGERHIVLTQNALADNSYLNYTSFLYGDQLATLTQEDSQRAFQEYLDDARKRATHDQEFPDEPKQLRPGEDVRITDGRLQVSGQVAVMSINEKLFQALMEKNPDTSFAMEQSFPLKSTYGAATTLGPIMELRVQDEQNALTPERAAQSIDYWRDTTARLLSDPEAMGSDELRKTYSKMAAEQATLFQDRNYTDKAEEGFRLATELCPYSPEAVFRYVGLLMTENRTEDALRAAESGLKAAPENQQFRDLVEQIRKTSAR